MSNRNTILSAISSFLGASSPIVTKSSHKPILENIANSYLNKESDAPFLGLKDYDPNKGYLRGEGTLKDGQLWIAIQGISIGTNWDVANFTQITGTVSLSDYNIPDWDSGYNGGSGYNENDQVVRDDRLWNSDSDANITDPLVSGWTEISANDGNFGNVWVNGRYKQNQVITNEADKKLYYLAVPTPTAQGFNSTDFAAELLNGDWVLFHDVGGASVPALPENNFYVGNGLNEPTPTDEIQKDTNGIFIKNQLSLPVGKKISLGGGVELFNDAGEIRLIQNNNLFLFDGPVRFSNQAPLFNGVTPVLFNSGLNFQQFGIPLINGNLVRGNLTGDRTWELPDEDGTIALKSNIPIIESSFEFAVSSYTFGALGIVTGCLFTVLETGNYQMTFSGGATVGNNSNAQLGLYQRTPPNPFLIKNESLRSLEITRVGNGENTIQTSVYSETLTFSAVAGDELALVGQILTGTVSIENGVFKVKKI